MFQEQTERLPEGEDPWLCYSRSFLLTFSLLFVVVPLALGWHFREHADSWHISVWIGFGAAALVGFVQFFRTLFASTAVIENWCTYFSGEIYGWFLIGIPLHLILKSLAFVWRKLR